MHLFLFQEKTFAAREAFDAFLKHFPYCYGYWKKYADYEQHHSGNEMAKEVGMEASMGMAWKLSCFVIKQHLNQLMHVFMSAIFVPPKLQLT